MRLQRLAILALASALSGLAGCTKASPKAGGLTAQVEMLDASKLRPAFEGAPAETQAQVNKVMLALGSSDLVGALSELESLTNNASVTEPQKQVAADLSQQIQKKLSETAPPGQ
ncbi:MAG: hypothetical protein ACREIC_25580 [Limisphaerales bacterium]